MLCNIVDGGKKHALVILPASKCLDVTDNMHCVSKRKRADEQNSRFRLLRWLLGHSASIESGNDGVHRVAAGGCLKNRKPAGRNSGATLCYALYSKTRT